MTVAIVAARGGSKRIPGKNILPMHGKPMLAWPIQAARDAGVFSRIIVSTDCPEIAETAQAAGAEVPGLRPAEISDDLATLDKVISWAISEYDVTSEWVCSLYATAVLLSPQTLRDACDKADQADFGTDFVMSLQEYPHPVQRAVTVDDGMVRMLCPENAMARTQDLEPYYHDAAQFVFGRRKAWLDGNTVWSSTTLGVVVPSDEAIDIDTPGDLDMARLRLRQKLEI